MSEQSIGRVIFAEVKSGNSRLNRNKSSLKEATLTVAGIWSIVEGVHTLANKSPDIEHDSTVDKRLFSPYTRYFLGSLLRKRTTVGGRRILLRRRLYYVYL